MKKYLGRSVEYLTGSLFVAMIIITFLQVIFRYVFNNSLTWSEELARYLFVWATLLGAALAIKHQSHMAMESLVAIFSLKVRKIVLVFSSILLITFSILITFSGYKLMLLAVKQKTTALEIPMPIIYVMFIVSGLLMIYYIIQVMFVKLKESSNNSEEVPSK